MATELMSAQDTDHFPLDRGYLFSGSGVGREIDANTAIKWLKHRDDSSPEFIWLHFHDIPTVLEGWPLQHVQLPEAFGDTLREGSRSTRITHVYQTLIAVLNDVEYDLERNTPLKVATLWVNVGVHCLISVRSSPLRSVSQLRQAVEAGETFRSPMALLIHLLQEQADVLIGIVRTAAQAANDVDETLLAGRLPTRSGLGGIRRDLVRLRRLLAPEPAALFRLVNRPPRWVLEEDAQSLRQSAEEFSLTLRDIAGLQERIKLLEEEIADRVAEHTNRSVLILTAVTVIALPVNLISGLLGMNIGGLPLKYDNHGFWIVALIALLLTSVAAWLIFRPLRD
ncbi:transporter [Burkholderia sp. R-70199]|jgi:Mg2+ and Co2+ transporters|uniref:Zinc transport protein ZntB n=1 Tax=Paraburkholderia domus TaxID=2793075 RepID=A0A9N8N3T2_9BURK|nr:transporter [Burkholderia sp. R-70006]MBK5064395.1 transporter [Burkholderia sp. R-70199]MBK5168367.1 transporter [Burkholderia sp. R-70211]CAE6762998.1 Zinc transport protein ZntB [Paraburkholderia domus]CAE6802788.1 Zinc transport protein ZntB [Paraburkholderia domus]